MWAVIGIYGGRENNAFYRRSENGLIELGAKTLDTKDVIPLGEAVIHSVTNPLEQITAAIHVYGGDFFATPRSEWDPKLLKNVRMISRTQCEFLKNLTRAFVLLRW